MSQGGRGLFKEVSCLSRMYISIVAVNLRISIVTTVNTRNTGGNEGSHMLQPATCSRS